jgi:hypothetical protein
MFKGGMVTGIGVMLHELRGGSPKTASNYYGRKITNAIFNSDQDQIELKFEDGISIRIWDDGQSCCESRYMKCDDNIKDLVGQKLVSILEKDAPNEKTENGDGVHEVCFLEIQGDKSSVSISTHNEHNGYYGGFSLSLDEF